MAEVPVLAPADGAATAAPARRRIPLWLLIAIGVLLLGGVGAGLVLTHAFGGAVPSHARKSAPVKPSGPPHYLALDPPFVVNFQANQLVRFLQVGVQVMSHDPKTLELIKHNDPMVRNALLLLLGNQKYATISTTAGKEQLRTDALAAIRKVVEQAGGDPRRVEAVYFTSFVMQ